MEQKVNINYQNDGITLYHGDCLEVMPEICKAIGENTVDAIIADLPYG